MTTNNDNQLHAELAPVLNAMKELDTIIHSEINRFTEKEFIDILLPILEAGEDIKPVDWFHYSGGPFSWVSIRDNEDHEKELFRVPPLVPSFRQPSRQESMSLSDITDRVHNVQHMGPHASRLLTKELQHQYSIMQRKGLVDEEQKAWEYIYETYAKPRLAQRGKHDQPENSQDTNVSISSQLSFKEEEL